MFQVLITDSVKPPLLQECQVLQDIADIRCLRATPEQPLKELVSDADALIVYHESTITPEVIDRMSHCRVIVRGGVGVDNIDLKAATNRGIRVCNIPDYGVDEVADHALGLLLALHRGIVQVERRLRDSLAPWDRRAVRSIGRLSECTLGIVGCGRIGSATARRAQAFKLRVLVYDPYLTPGMEKALDVTRVDWDTLLAESDAISLHTPLTPQTRHLINTETLSRLRADCLLVNTARGAVVDTDALAHALQSGKLGGAAIDVLPHEPPDSQSELVRLWQDRTQDVNLIITPHIAYYSNQAIEEIRVKGAQEVRRVLLGHKPLHCVNLPQSSC
jgi:D-3-phosphoglycerate dehydrogenase/C-terminal binding protein